jgi:uncharacterized membrane protein
MATNTILGVFDDPIAARRAVERLRDGTLDLDDVSIVSRATESGEAVSSADDVSAGEGAAVGAVWGGLIGLASLLIPGVGPFIAIGALGAALAGAVTGAVVGGVAAALIDFGDISEPEAREYEKQVHAGMTLVAVKAREDLAHDVRQILANAGAESIRDNQTGMADASDLGVRVATYDASGQRVSMEEEYGQPSDPSTVGRRGVYDLPQVDRAGNMVQPLVEAEPTIDEPVAAGRAHALEPRHSGTYADDDRPADVLRPETLGAKSSTRREDDADVQARSFGASEPAPDASVGTGRAGQVQPRSSGEGVERPGDEDLTTPDAPATPRATGPDTNLPDPNTGGTI